MEQKNTLNGFETILDGIIPNVGANTDDDLNDAVEELTDEELETLRGKDKDTELDDDTDDDNDKGDSDKDVDIKDTKKKKTDKKVTDDTTDVDDIDSDEEIIVSFFDSLASQLDWDEVDDKSKPKTAEDLVNYFKDVIQENSTPDYASKEVEELDNFVRNGGSLKDYFNIDADLDITDIEVEDNEVNQKLIVKEFLKEKGYSSKSIDKKLVKYEDAGILEDEAIDALEELREIREKKKE